MSSSAGLLVTTALDWGGEVLVGLPRRIFEGPLLLLCSHLTFAFDVIDTSLVEGGVGVFVA